MECAPSHPGLRTHGRRLMAARTARVPLPKSTVDGPIDVLLPRHPMRASPKFLMTSHSEHARELLLVVEIDVTRSLW
jgi:hypothetical protein